MSALPKLFSLVVNHEIEHIAISKKLRANN